MLIGLRSLYEAPYFRPGLVRVALDAPLFGMLPQIVAVPSFPPDGDLLLPPRGTGLFEQTQARVIASRLPDAFALAEVIRTLWNPATCPESELPILAWAFSVDYWDTSWTVSRKRQVVGEARLYHSRKTTVAGISMALGYRDAALVKAYTPRLGFFADRSADPAAEAAWRASLPEIRVYDAAPVILPRRAWGFAGVNCFARDDARLARKAALDRGGVETPLQIIPLGDPSARGERIVLPIPKEPALVCGRAGNRYALPTDFGIKTLALHIGSGDEYERPLATPGDSGAFVQSRRRQDAGISVAFTPAGRGGPRTAAPAAIARGYTALKFSDQPGRLSAHAPANVVGRSRVMRAAFTANFLVDWRRVVPKSHFATGRKVAASSEPTVLKLMHAIGDAQALRDRNSLSLSATRRLNYGDLRAVQSGARYGDRRENT